MNDIRDRLGDAASAVGETVRQEDLPAEPAALRARRRSRLPYLAPLAAAAVLVVVVGTVFAVRLTRDSEPARPSHVAGGVPSFSIDANHRDRIEVRSVTTGKVISTTGRGVLHGKTSWEVATGAPDNRHFYLATTGCTRAPKIYELVLDDRGRVKSFGPTEILLMKGTKVVDMDATSNRKIVGAQGSCRGNEQPSIFTANLVTHSYGGSTFRGEPSGSSVLGVSISGDGRRTLLTIGHPDGPATFVLLLTNHDGHRVTFRGKYGSVRGAVLQAWLTPDGRSLVGYVGDTGEAGGPSGPDYGLVQYTLSGKPTRALAHWSKRKGSETVCAGYGSRWLVTLSGNGHTRLGWVEGGSYHALPNSAGRNVEVGVCAW